MAWSVNTVEQVSSRLALRTHILGEGGANGCAEVPGKLRDHIVENANRSSVLVCATIHVGDLEYYVYIISTPRGILIQDVVAGDNPLIVQKMRKLMTQEVDTEMLVLCLTDTPSKKAVWRIILKYIYGGGVRDNWMSYAHCPFGELLEVICTLFNGRERCLEWGSFIFHFLVKCQGFTWTGEVDNFFVPEGLKWSPRYVCSRVKFDGILKKFNALSELLRQEATLRAELNFDYSNIPDERAQQILDYESICNIVLMSNNFWQNAKYIVEVGGPLLKALSSMAKGCTADELYLGISDARETLRSSRHHNDVGETVQKLAKMVEGTIYEAAALFHPRSVSKPSGAVVKYLSKLLESHDSEAFLREMQVFEASLFGKLSHPGES